MLSENAVVSSCQHALSTSGQCTQLPCICFVCHVVIKVCLMSSATIPMKICQASFHRAPHSKPPRLKLSFPWIIIYATLFDTKISLQFVAAFSLSLSNFQYLYLYNQKLVGIKTFKGTELFQHDHLDNYSPLFQRIFYFPAQQISFRFTNRTSIPTKLYPLSSIFSLHVLSVYSIELFCQSSHDVWIFFFQRQICLWSLRSYTEQKETAIVLHLLCFPMVLSIHCDF